MNDAERARATLHALNVSGVSFGELCEELGRELSRLAYEIAMRHASNALTEAADNVRRELAKVRTWSPGKTAGERAEQARVLDHYLDKLLDLLPSAAEPAVLPSGEP